MMVLMIVMLLSILLVPIKNYFVDKTLILMKIITFILIIQTCIEIELFKTSSNSLVLLSKNDRIIINIRDYARKCMSFD